MAGFPLRYRCRWTLSRASLAQLAQCIQPSLAPGIADRLDAADQRLAEARRQRAAFFDRFPGIAAGILRAEDGAVRGFAPIIGGLRRWIAPGAKSTNQHVNTPMQGAAGVVFRKALVDLHRHVRGTSIALVRPVNDAVLLECAADAVTEVAAEAALIIKSAVRAYFPELRPRIDVNAEAPTCWNKEGNRTRCSGS